MSTTDGAIDLATRIELLSEARRLHGTGAVTQAWTLCEEVARLSRSAGDPTTMADAATVIRAQTNATLMGQVHSLCVEALARLGDSDPVRSVRVRAQLVATSSPFADEVVRSGFPVQSDDAEGEFLLLQARHAELMDAEHLLERLGVATAAIELGLGTGRAEYMCWGLRWRMDVHAVLGHRVDLVTDLATLEPLVLQLGQSTWRSYLLMVTASQRLWDGRFDEARRLSQEAVDQAGPQSEAAYFQLLTEWDVHRLTGEDLTEIEAAVRTVVDGLPWLARGWLCLVLLANGRRTEAAALWSSVAPHVRRLPARAPEWLIAGQGHADLCVAFGDVETARVVYDELQPHEALHSIGYAHSPYGGPVSLGLGRLALLLGERERGRQHLELALRTCTQLHALPYLAITHATLAPVAGLHLRSGREHAEQALQLARRLGMRPLEQEVLTWLAGRPLGEGGLTVRETEVAALVAEGMSNASIAQRLTVSERTVENHLSHILRKVDRTSRAGVAAWYVQRRPAGSL